MREKERGMRTATKFYCGKSEEFKKILQNYCVGGSVGVIAQDKEEGKALCDELKKEYKPLLYGIKEADEIALDARFLIGVGGSGVIAAVKRAKRGRKYAFIPAKFDYRFLYDFEERSLPEFVFLNEKATGDKDYCLRLYGTIFQLYAEWAFDCVFATAMPFRDKVAETYCKVGKSLLLGEKDEEAYYGEGIRFVQGSVNAFFERNKKALLTEKMAFSCGVTTKERFATARFLLLLAKNFTKSRFGGILVPSLKTGTGETSAQGSFFDGSVLPSEKETERMESFVNFLAKGDEPTEKKLLLAFNENARVHPLFSIIQEEGITDALYYERFERHTGIFV